MKRRIPKSTLFPYTTLFRSVRDIYSMKMKSIMIRSNKILIKPKQTVGDRISKDKKERSEEHTSELQSRGHLVCRLLLEKKKLIMINRSCLNSCNIID